MCRFDLSLCLLQVSSAAGQLDAVAQLLQQARTAFQSAQSGESAPNQHLMEYPGLLTDMDGLDELLFLTYLQAQYNNGGWAEAMGLFKQLQQVGAARSLVLLQTAVLVTSCSRRLAA